MTGFELTNKGVILTQQKGNWLLSFDLTIEDCEELIKFIEQGRAYWKRNGA